MKYENRNVALTGHCIVLFFNSCSKVAAFVFRQQPLHNRGGTNTSVYLHRALPSWFSSPEKWSSGIHKYTNSLCPITWQLQRKTNSKWTQEDAWKLTCSVTVISCFSGVCLMLLWDLVIIPMFQTVALKCQQC